jgi:hypothetical protein
LLFSILELPDRLSFRSQKLEFKTGCFMTTRVIIAFAIASFVASIAFSQMKYSRANSQRPTPTPTPKTTPVPAQSPAPQQRTTSAPRTTPAPLQQKALPTPAPTVAKPTPTPVPPPDVKAYLDRQVANSKDKKFHMTVNGKDLALTPFHVWAQKSTGVGSTSTCIDMKSDDGRIYDIDFVTTSAQVSGIKIHKINGEALR